MGTDPEPTMRNKADQQLVEIDKKYTGFIHVSDIQSIHLHQLIISIEHQNAKNSSSDLLKIR